MIITPTFTANFDTNFGANAQAAKDAWIAAAEIFSNNFSDNIHINITVDAVPGTGIFGHSNFGLVSISYAELLQLLSDSATTQDDRTAIGAGGSISPADPTNGGPWYLTRSQAKALGFVPDDMSEDGITTFGTGFAFTFSGPVIAGTYDFQGIAAHEISEVMGRIGLSGSFNAPSNSFGLIDNFSYTGPGARGLRGGPGNNFSIDNGNTLLKLFNDPSVNGFDSRDWAPGSNDAFNQFSASGVENAVSAVDLQVMDVIGYTVNVPIDWTSLGGQITDPVVASNADGRLEVFARGADNTLWHTWQASPGGGWSGWVSLGGGIAGRIAVAQNADGRLEVFVIGTDSGALWHIWQVSPGGGWSAWNSLTGRWVSDPVVARNADGRLEAFVRGGSGDGVLYHNWQVSAGGGWSGWNSMGGALAGRACIQQNLNGRFEVFARATAGDLRTIVRVPGGNWSSWISLGGGLAGDPTVGRNSDGRLEVFVQGTDNALWHIWETVPGGGWSAWASLGGAVGDPNVIANADGRLEVFARALSNGQLIHIWQTSPGGGWSSWRGLGGVLAEGPIAARNLDGRLEVFVKGTDAAVWHCWQQAANTNSW